jgi:rRNA maturation protein Nop10
MADTDADPRTVFVAENARIADAVIQLLAASGIPAELAAPGPQTSSALTGMSDAPADEFPIVVTDPTKLTDARELLATAATMSAVRAIREKRATRTGTVTATCEDCGKSSDWPAPAMGTTEVCPHCGAYMDIPDPDEDWSDVDFGAADEGAKE